MQGDSVEEILNGESRPVSSNVVRHWDHPDKKTGYRGHEPFSR
jgi:hypothetical protein